MTKARTKHAMTPKQRVLALYPTAVCEHNGDLGYEINVIGKYGKTIKVLGRHHYYKRSAWANACSALAKRRKP